MGNIILAFQQLNILEAILVIGNTIMGLIGVGSSLSGKGNPFMPIINFVAVYLILR